MFNSTNIHIYMSQDKNQKHKKKVFSQTIKKEKYMNVEEKHGVFTCFTVCVIIN